MARTQAIPLLVPPWEERDALDAGARYTRELGYHLAEEDNLFDFTEWLPRKYHPNATSPYLLPDMLPTTTHGVNVRSSVSAARWDELRRYTYAAAGFRCEACGCGGEHGAAYGCNGSDSPHVECHELWQFDDASGIQRLLRLVSLCPLCHKAKHIGFANRIGILPRVLTHLRQLNGWDQTTLDTHLEQLSSIWARRSAREWTLDLSWLNSYRVTGFAYRDAAASAGPKR